MGRYENCRRGRKGGDQRLIGEVLETKRGGKSGRKQEKSGEDVTVGPLHGDWKRSGGIARVANAENGGKVKGQPQLC